MGVSYSIVESSVTWRWVFWVMFFFAAGCTLVMIPLLPETYAPVLLRRKVDRLRKEDPEGSKHLYAEHERQDWSFKGVIHRTLFRPFSMLLGEPILFLITVYLSIVYGLLYARKSIFPMKEQHGLSPYLPSVPSLPYCFHHQKRVLGF